MIMWVRICFYIAKKPGIGSFVSHGMWIVYAAYKFNSRKQCFPLLIPTGWEISGIGKYFRNGI